ncbi:MAG TPA: hypothetical protein VE244_04120 [Nitrososphaeraceae archaeon]|nr:hypothetical protein [Nitrososphaeraceae archaeon]
MEESNTKSQQQSAQAKKTCNGTQIRQKYSKFINLQLEKRAYTAVQSG